MPQIITPSEKVHNIVNPLPVSHDPSIPEDNKIILILKLLVGTPIPYLLWLYSAAVLVSMSAMEITAWAAAGLTLIYIVLDIFSKRKEFRWYLLGADLSLIGYLFVAGIGLHLNAPNADIVTELGNLRWIVLLYLLTYSFSLFPGLNRLLYVIIGLGSIVAGYAVFQHFSGIDLRYDFGLREASAVTKAPFKGADVYQSVGLMSHHLTYGYSFSMVFCFVFAALVLSKKKALWLRAFLLISTLALGMSLLWTYGRGVWIAVACAILFMAAYVSRKAVFALLIVGSISVGTFYSLNHGFRERLDSIWASNYTSNTDRQDLWRANIEMLSDYPWVGIGYHQNETRLLEYYQRLGISNTFTGHAHNTYLNVLSTTGVLGFVCFMLFIISYLLMTHRIWADIPKSHYWHRVLILGALGAQIAMHTGGLTQWNFGDAEVNHLFILVLAMVGYTTERYTSGVVPDDHSI